MADFPVPASKRPKLSGYDFYKQVLGSPKYVVSNVFCLKRFSNLHNKLSH